MNPEPATTPAKAERPAREPQRANWTHVFAQQVLGIGCYLVFVFPYVREIAGLAELPRGQRFIFASNHVSLLDTLVLGGILWSRQRLPLLVLGDQAVWHANWLRRLLSAKLGFLIARDRHTKTRLSELANFGRSGETFDLLVFPEGTRGDGRTVGACQPGIYYVSRAAGLPLVPVFLENMQRVSSKRGTFHPLRGLRQVKVRFGPPIPPEELAALDRTELVALVRERMQALAPGAAVSR